MDNKDQNNGNPLHKNEVEKNTRLAGENIERLPASDDDYRLPQSLPEPEEKEYQSDIDSASDKDEADGLINDNTEISDEEIALLEEADVDTESDEAIASRLLDETDEDGDPLNESSGQDVFFDTGEDLDMTNDVNNPDIDEEDEEF